MSISKLVILVIGEENIKFIYIYSVLESAALYSSKRTTRYNTLKKNRSRREKERTKRKKNQFFALNKPQEH